jgi:hypothetical protein
MKRQILTLMFIALLFATTLIAFNVQSTKAFFPVTLNNGIWTQAGSEMDVAHCNAYVASNISGVYMQAGWWDGGWDHSGNTIAYIAPENFN